LNDLKPFSELAQKYGKVFIVDAMSSFGGIEIDVAGLKIDFLISSANKCIQGTPGFSFIIAKLDKLEASRGNARTLSLDLHDQYDGMHEGKWRFTSPTHIVLAFLQALKELDAEGGVKARQARYQGNMDLVRKNFSELGIKPYLPAELQSPIITTFEYPKENFSFLDMYNFIKERGFAIYPGKLMGLDTFRIGVIGEIYPEDIEKLSAVMAEYFAQ
jgi:2-aminoethylphosphonate-pyruvate transaminase